MIAERNIVHEVVIRYRSCRNDDKDALSLIEEVAKLLGDDWTYKEGEKGFAKRLSDQLYAVVLQHQDAIFEESTHRLRVALGAGSSE